MKAIIEKKDDCYLIHIYGNNGIIYDTHAVENIYIQSEHIKKYDELRFYKGLGIAVILGMIVWAILVITL